MVNELSKFLPQTNEADIQKRVDDALAVSKSGDWLPRLQVTTGTSTLVGEGKINVGRVVLVTGKDNFKDLGKSVEISLINFRSLALDMSGSPPMSYYDRNTAEFKDVANRADNVQNSNCSYGPQFLVWIPSESQFATLHLSSKSSRKEGPNLLSAMKDPETGKIGIGQVVMEPFFIKTEKNQWWTPSFKPSSTPVTSLPDAEAFADTLQKFLNPPKSTVEKAPETAGADRQR